MVVVTNDGLEYQARYANQSTVGSWCAMAIASGSTAEAITLTALTSELTGTDRARKATTNSYEADYKSVWYAKWTFTSAATVRSAGVFNSTTVAGSKMLLYHLFSADKVFATGESYELTFKLTQAT